MIEIINSTLQIKRGLSSAWQKNNPILAPGEPGWTLDTHILKIGDGVTPWNLLAPVTNMIEFAGNYYKDLTAEFNAQMEEGNIKGAIEFLLQQAITGKYCIYDYANEYKFFYCEVNEYNGIFYHTITSYSDDGFKTVSEYVDREIISNIDSSSLTGTTYYTKLHVIQEPEFEDDVTNKKYVDESINSASAVYSVENNCLFIRHNK